MPEIKNTFLKSKMNKDLDDRLISSGEYRDAQNISISKSEDSDVGAIENILGNIIKTDFGLSANCNLETIGYYSDVVNDRLFVFLTDYVDTSVDYLSNHSFDTNAHSYICVYNINTGFYNTLVTGSFLNFSTTHPITGVNLLEDLFFWTDNRNQPRKINVDIAINDDTYYSKEEHISVAKYYPYEPIDLFKTDYIQLNPTQVLGDTSSMRDVVSDKLPDGETDNPHQDDDWKGDSNYLRDKFVRFSYRFKFEDGEYSLIAPFTQIAFIPEQDGYFLDDNMLIADLEEGKAGNADLRKTYKSTILSFMRNKVNDISLMIPPPSNSRGAGTWAVAYDDFKITEIDILYKESDGLAIQVIDTIKNEIDPFADATIDSVHKTLEYIYNSQRPYKTLPDFETIRVNDVVPVKALSQEIVGNRVVYGNFIDKHTPPKFINFTAATAKKGGLETTPITSTIRKEYQNHTLKQNRSYQVGIVLSDLYGRQSDVILSSSVDKSTIYHPYKTGGTDPFSYTMGSDYLISGDDTWPGDCLRITFNEGIPATLAQESGYPGLWSESNPLGWFSYKIVVKQQEQDYYNVYFPGVLNGWTNIIPDVWDPAGPHDKDHGKTAAVATSSDPIGHMVLHGDNIEKIPRDLKRIGGEQVVFKSTVLETTPINETSTYYENLRIYNDANAGVLIGDTRLFGGDLTLSRDEWWNQVQRDMEIDGIIARDWVKMEAMIPNENSSVRLYPRVINTWYDKGQGQDYPYSDGGEFRPDKVISIATGFDFGLWLDSPDPRQYTWAYNVESNPLIARLEMEDFKAGVAGGTADHPAKVDDGDKGQEVGYDLPDRMKPDLAIYETHPVESRLQLYWETSTTGYIGTLNSDIDKNDNVSVHDFIASDDGAALQSNFNEDDAASVAVVDSFIADNDAVGELDEATMSLVRAYDGNNTTLTSKFSLESIGSGVYKVKTNSTWYHKADQASNRWNFDIKVTNGTNVSNGTIENILLGNVAPVFTAPTEATALTTWQGLSTYINLDGGHVYTATAKNGAIVDGDAGGVGHLKEVTWDIFSQSKTSGSESTIVDYFYLISDSTDGSIQLWLNSAEGGTTAGTYEVVLKATDGGGLNTHSSVLTVTVV